MKKSITILMLGIASLTFANGIIVEKSNSPLPMEYSKVKINHPLNKKDAFVWKYLYRATCGEYFYIELDKPFGELSFTERQRLELDLVIKNNEICANKQHKTLTQLF